MNSLDGLWEYNFSIVFLIFGKDIDRFE